MTKEEVREKYGTLPLYFSNYYKYRFWYSAIAADGKTKVSAAIGGDCNDIYRLEVKRDEPITILGDCPSYVAVSDGYSGDWEWEDSYPPAGASV